MFFMGRRGPISFALGPKNLGYTTAQFKLKQKYVAYDERFHDFAYLFSMNAG
jgi:hypothetical protein